MIPPLDPTTSYDRVECALEPISTPAHIQPHGCMIVCDSELRVIAVSQNVEHELGLAAQQVLGHPVQAVAGVGASSLAQAVPSGNPPGFVPPRQIRIGGVEFVGMAFATRDGFRVIELEPGRLDAGHVIQLRTLIGPTLTDAIVDSGSIEESLTLVCSALRNAIGVNRTLAYKFLPGWHGQVVAESVAHGQPRFLNHHFPASDIPAQARELYRRNLVRVIRTRDYDPVPLVGMNEDAIRFDMTPSWLRSVSPVHRAYLKNLGVQSSLSLSIVTEGRLWGLIALHHDEPLDIPFSTRQALELLAQSVAIRLEGVFKHESHAARERVSGLFKAASLATPHEHPVFESVNSDGCAVIRGDHISTHGFTPAPTCIREVRHLLLRKPTAFPAAVNGVRWLQLESGDDFGFIAVPIPDEPRNFVIWFRRTIQKSLAWAGDPTAFQTGVDLSPRASFETWREVKSGTCPDWTDSDQASASQCLIEIQRDPGLLCVFDAEEKRPRSDGARP